MWRDGFFFSGSIPPVFEHKVRCHQQRFGKMTATAGLDKYKKLLWTRLQWHQSCHSNEMASSSILLAAVFLGIGTFFPTSFTGAFSSNCRLRCSRSLSEICGSVTEIFWNWSHFFWFEIQWNWTILIFDRYLYKRENVVCEDVRPFIIKNKNKQTNKHTNKCVKYLYK